MWIESRCQNFRSRGCHGKVEGIRPAFLFRTPPVGSSAASVGAASFPGGACSDVWSGHENFDETYFCGFQGFQQKRTWHAFKIAHKNINYLTLNDLRVHCPLGETQSRELFGTLMSERRKTTASHGNQNPSP